MQGRAFVRTTSSFIAFLGDKSFEVVFRPTQVILEKNEQDLKKDNPFGETHFDLIFLYIEKSKANHYICHFFHVEEIATTKEEKERFY